LIIFSDRVDIDYILKYFHFSTCLMPAAAHYVAVVGFQVTGNNRVGCIR
jgi:hypothetical protein